MNRMQKILTSLTVCHVCSGHRADDVRVFQKECLSLRRHGYDVVLLGVSEEKEEYVKEGVRVIPLTHPRGGLLDKLKRREQIAVTAAKTQPDLFHVHEPELLAPVLRRAGSKPVVYDVHESYLDVLQERDWLPRLLKKIFIRAWDRSERRLVRRTAGVIVVTDPIAERYRKMHGRLEVIANFPALAALTSIGSHIENRDGLVYVGAVRHDRGIFQIIDALAILKNKGRMLSFLIAGPPAEEYILKEIGERAAQKNISEQVKYVGVVKRSQVMRIQAKAAVGVVAYQPVKNSIAGLPNKLVEFMGLGIPVVFSDFPVYREVAGETRAGIPVEPSDPEAIAEAVERILSDRKLADAFGQAGKKAVRERFNWDRQEEKLLRLYADILQKDTVGEMR